MSTSRIDPALLERLKLGDPTAAAEFLQLYKEAVCQRMCINMRRFSDRSHRRPTSGDSFRSEVESQFNNAYAKTMEKIRRGELDDSFSPVAYMSVIASHRSIDRIRSQKRNRIVSLDGAPEPSAEAPFDQSLLAKEVVECFNASLHEFNAREQAVFRLRYIDDLSVAEVAQALELDKATVRARCSDVIKKLRELCDG